MAGLIKAGVAGAMGRMGRALIEAVGARDDVQIAALYDRPGSEGQIAAQEGGGGRVLVARDAALAASDVILDFTTPEASVQLAQAASDADRPALVIGSTGLSDAQEAQIAAAAQHVAIVRSGNFSLGVNTLMGLVEQAAHALGPKDWDVEIFEAHHRRKVDAPSGTALMLGRAAARGRDVSLNAVADRGRDGITGARREGAIGFSVVRGGGIFGEHKVIFAAEDEILTLEHSALGRGLFARGAVEAALWVSGKPPGLYSMMDVLGFNSKDAAR